MPYSAHFCIFPMYSVIDRKLRAIFPGLRAEPFGFRVFKTHELSDFARNGDTQHSVEC